MDVNPRVVVTEEADPRPELRQGNVEALRLTGIALPLTMPVETHARGRVVRQHDIYAIRVCEPFDLIRSVVTPRVTLQLVRSIGRFTVRTIPTSCLQKHLLRCFTAEIAMFYILPPE